MSCISFDAGVKGDGRREVGGDLKSLNVFYFQDMLGAVRVGEE